MQRQIILWLLVLMVLCGCGSENALLEAVDFSFTLPEGYSITCIENLRCTVQRDADSVAVGGMEAVPLTRRDLKESSAKSILEYLQTVFHQTNNVEFIASHYGGECPVASINMRVHREDGTQNMFTHYFFEKDNLIYHLWLDTDLLGDADPGSFLSTVTG